jgi:hypothetical protein
MTPCRDIINTGLQGSDARKAARSANTAILAVLDLVRFVGAPTGLISIALALIGGSQDYPTALRRRQGWAVGLDNMWASQYSEFYELAIKRYEEEFAAEEEELQPGFLGSVPLLVLVAGMTNADGTAVTCDQTGCALGGFRILASVLIVGCPA